MSDHFHYGEYAEARHDHRGEYADERHDHDLDYAGKHHQHFDLEGAVAAAVRQVRELQDDLLRALQRIDALDRMRPTCVVCYDAAADQQTSRGPACSGCVGEADDPVCENCGCTHLGGCLTCGCTCGLEGPDTCRCCRVTVTWREAAK